MGKDFSCYRWLFIRLTQKSSNKSCITLFFISIFKRMITFTKLRQFEIKMFYHKSATLEQQDDEKYITKL